MAIGAHLGPLCLSEIEVEKTPNLQENAKNSHGKGGFDHIMHSPLADGLPTGGAGLTKAKESRSVKTKSTDKPATDPGATAILCRASSGILEPGPGQQQYYAAPRRVGVDLRPL